MAFSIGQQVGPYRIEQKLGQGGMATVYKAYHEALDRHVAVKVMHIALSEDETFLERFKREAQIVGKLLHTNIIPIFDYAAFENQPYLVMQYVGGQTLKQRMRSRPLTLQEVTDVLNAVASALDYAHQNDVLHRDVKPSNIMLDERERPYLTDFGLARIASLGESTLSTDMMLGTPQYISPEQAKGVRNLDAGTDIYSLGVVLYELVVGRVPFTADTPYTIIHDHIYKPLPLPTQVNPGVPPEVEWVLVKVLHKERSQRYNTAGELAAAFARAVQQSEMEEISHHKLRREDFEEHSESQSASAANPSRTADGIPIEVITPTPVDRAAAERQSQVRSRIMPQGEVGYPAPPTPTPTTPTPSPAVPSPMMGGSVLVPGAPIDYSAQRTGNGWTIAGCLVFIVSCLVSGAIVLGAMNEPHVTEEWDDVRDRIVAGENVTASEDTISLLTLAAQNELTPTILEDYASASNPDSAREIDIVLATALLVLQDDEPDAARELIEELDATQPDDVETVLAWADVYADNGFSSASLHLYALAVMSADEDTQGYDEAVLELNEHFARLIADQALTQRDVDLYAEALPNSIDVLFAEALINYQDGNAEAGMTWLEQTRTAEAENAVSERWLYWANVMDAYELPAAAADVYIAAMTRFPDNEDVQAAARDYLYTQMLLAAEQNRLSQSEVETYAAYFPDTVEVEFARALISFETGNREAGMQILIESIVRNQIQSSDSPIILDWAGVFATRGYSEQALISHLFAYFIDGENETVREVSGGYLYDRAVNSTVEDALMFCTARAELPNFTFMQIVTAQSFMSADIDTERPLAFARACPDWRVTDSVEALLQAALVDDPGFAELYLVYGNFYQSSDQPDQALENWERAAAFADAPSWVQTRAENKIALYNSGAGVAPTESQRDPRPPFGVEERN
jgi:serine/threonine protein kinase/tetratricopeptide (TPR) repeat protein